MRSVLFFNDQLTVMKKLVNVLLIFALFPGTALLQNTGFIKSPVPDLNTGRIDSRVALLSDGRIIVFGGHIPGFHRSNTAESWKTGETGWTSYTMSDYRDNSAIASLGNDKFLLLGGMSSSLGVGQLATTELYDGATNLFTAMTPMNVARGNCRAARLAGGKVLVLGNWYASATYGELYDPKANTFTLTGPVITPRASPYIVPLPDGNAIVMGGTGPQGGDVESIELYDAGTNTFLEIKSSLFDNQTGWIYNTVFSAAMTGPEDRMIGDNFYFAASRYLAIGSRQHNILALNTETKVIAPVLPDATELFFDPLRGDSIAYQLPGNLYVDKAKGRLLFWGYNTKTVEGSGAGFALFSVDVATGKIYKPANVEFLNFDPSLSSGGITSQGEIIVAGGRFTNNFDAHPHCFRANPTGITTGEKLIEGYCKKMAVYAGQQQLKIFTSGLPEGKYLLKVISLNGSTLHVEEIKLYEGVNSLQVPFQYDGLSFVRLSGTEGDFSALVISH